MMGAEVGKVFLWEGWLRHEVSMDMAEEDRRSVSFKCGWGLLHACKCG